jgi:aspartyl-tRNA(Asn)/glutamyl-tRNA(Gln) amidotransferase subunit C
MTKITKEEILKIARMSHLEIQEHEIEPLRTQLESVLSYAECVQEVLSDMQDLSRKQVNVFREDVIVDNDVEPILSQAPEREGDFFVVPAIIEQAKK